MPMGAVSAFYGIKGCMSILHGSQGCATYIRRHMATHYNEPVDIGSSSLTEEGTVFGGETNLLKGLHNLIELYHPEVIGVATTCLAETIGEDVEAIIKNFRSENPENKVDIIHVASAGYGGTQYEGFFKALRSIVSQTMQKTEKNEYINIITPQISPADTRWLKAFLNEVGIPYILLPDISDNLDGVSVTEYERLKSGGTSLQEVGMMAGAKLTIEFSEFISNDDSPAVYLKENYGVPFVRLPLPTGIRAMDRLISLLKEHGGHISDSIIQERGRYLDGMVDSHKYCAEGRAAIFGEPDFVKSMTSLCCENGLVPVLSVTGSVCPSLKSILEPEINTCADRYFISKTIVADDCDFATIEVLCKELNVNLMIGSSDGRRVAQKLGIPLVRCAFPIHDRVGGQRIRTIGFDGSLAILDHAANLMFGHKEETFRSEMYKKYFDHKETYTAGIEKRQENITDSSLNTDLIAEKTKEHPCFNCGASKNARIHLPIAPKCNIQCNYCVRKFDCPNESRPGVTTEVLTPEEAFKKYAVVKEKVDRLTVVGIAGPGDALANFEETKKTLQLIREYDPNVTFCLSTNGLMLPRYAKELIQLGVTHITVTINAVDPTIGSKIYKHIDYMGERFTGEAAAAILLANQLAGLQILTSYNIICKVNCVVLKGINDHHIFDITKKAKELGVYMTNIMPHIPVEGSNFENLERINNKAIDKIRTECGVNIKQMRHCRQCRSDAIGTLENDVSIEYRRCTSLPTASLEEIPKKKYAVATKSGTIVDQHFGQADEFYIYESDGNSAAFLEKRKVSQYCSGPENCTEHENRIDLILSVVSDCSGVLALRVGASPSKKLKDKGIAVISTYDRVENAVLAAAASC
jgi:nitrogenase molybdenum-iron protein alpha/beta subunit/MoaA/NifB/PqqE/SkfB family radical SAM enzyme